MVVVKSLSGMNQPYTREQQCAVKPLPAIREKGKQGYAEATSRATKDGQLFCEDCNRPVPKGREERHHLKKRSQMGGNESSNLVLVCRDCHAYREAHGGKKKPGRKAK